MGLNFFSLEGRGRLNFGLRLKLLARLDVNGNNLDFPSLKSGIGLLHRLKATRFITHIRVHLNYVAYVKHNVKYFIGVIPR